jgi:hypothetical protein
MGDDGAVCDLSGKLSEGAEHLTLQMKCPKSNVELKGMVSREGNSIVGSYLARYPGLSNDLDRFEGWIIYSDGTFAMSRASQP